MKHVTVSSLFLISHIFRYQQLSHSNYEHSGNGSCWGFGLPEEFVSKDAFNGSFIMQGISTTKKSYQEEEEE